MKKISTKVLIPVVLLAVIAVISAVTGLKMPMSCIPAARRSVTQR
ncbi:MAG: hypothetical protein ACLR78_15640 [Roseburia sp.]